MFKDLLKENKISCYRLAKDSSVSYTTINELYRGERQIGECSIDVGKKISSTVGMSLDELCRWCEKRANIPEKLFECFWDRDPKELDLLKDKVYVITRLLDKGGYEGLSFIKNAYSYEEFKYVAMNSRNFSPQNANFVKVLFKLKENEMDYYKMKVQDWRL